MENSEMYLECRTFSMRETNCECRVVFKDDNSKEDVLIRIEPNCNEQCTEENNDDEDIFFYVNSVFDLSDLCSRESSHEDFYIEEIYCIY